MPDVPGEHGSRRTQEGHHSRVSKVELPVPPLWPETWRVTRPRLDHAEEAKRLRRIDGDTPSRRRFHPGRFDGDPCQFSPDGVLERVGEVDEGVPSACGSDGDGGDSGEVDPAASPPEGSRVSGAL